MRTVDLFTGDGGLVATIKVPPFHPMPEVIIWGQRFFVRQPDGQYREGMAWYSTDLEGIGREGEHHDAGEGS
jgi:hypothetical protein